MSSTLPRTTTVPIQNPHETAVGITVFVRPETISFQCIVKQRYSDFLVNEVRPDGHVLHLVETTSGKQKKRKRQENGKEESHTEDSAIKKLRVDGDNALKDKDEGVSEVKPDTAHGNLVEKEAQSNQDISAAALKAEAIASIPETDKTAVASVFGQQVANDIVNLYASVLAHPDRKPRDHNSVKSEHFAEKSKRTDAHACIRRVFKSKLETVTVQDQDNQSGPGTITIRAAAPRSANDRNGGARGEEGQRGKQNWAELGGEYLHFTLYKENKDTMEVLYFLASQLKLHVKHFSFAGTKDRRAVTVQRVAIFRMRQERMEGLNKLSKGWVLGGPWEYKKEPLELGMLKGNEFVLTLRDVVFQGEEPEWDLDRRLQHASGRAREAAESLSESGFLNYYGLQRFGTHSIGTHVVGMKMLKGDLKGAIDAILAYDQSLVASDQSEDANGEQRVNDQKKIPQDEVARATALHKYGTTGSSNEALPLLPGNRFQAEKGLIMYLGKRDRKTGKHANENDFQGALMQIQRNLRLMYVHAYQSFIWNTVVGKRWQDFGSTVIEGDLVVVGEKELEEGSSAKPVAVDEVDEDGEPIIHPSASANPDAPEGLPVGATPDDPFVRARPLSKEEAESGRFNIFDIVLPLPGYDVEYPKNDIGKFYETLMSSEQGGHLDPHSMRRAWKDISLSGGYRKMMARPLGEGVQVEVHSYEEPDEQLVVTDLEKIKNQAAHGGSAQTGNTTGSSEKSEKTKLAIVAKLQLGSSQYATMALRELTNGGATAYTPDYSVANR